MKLVISTAALTRARAVIGGRLAWSLAPLAAGFALGALAMTVIEPAPRHEARVTHPAVIEPAPRHEARVTHPAVIEPAAGIVADTPPVIRLADVPRPVPTPRLRPSLESLPAWRVHAVAAPPIDGQAMIAVIIDDMGLDRRRSRHAATLPAPLTLAYLPHARDLAGQTRAARARGHELLVHVPMEGNAPSGVNTLRPRHTAEELLRRLDWSLGRFEGFVGVNNHMGSRFTANPKALRVVLGALERRGLLFVDSRTTPDSAARSLARATGVAFASRDVVLDHNRGKEAVEARLAELERIAGRRGRAVAIGHPHQITIEVLRAWIPEARRRGFVLVPISTIVGRTRTLGRYEQRKSPAPLGG